jgi:hypothetical protein
LERAVDTTTATVAREARTRFGLSRAVWLLLAVDLLAAVGVGLTQPYLVTFLHNGKASQWPLPLQ